MKKYNSEHIPDLIISIILLFTGIFVFFYSNTIFLMRAVEKSSVVNAQFYPKLLSVILIGSSIFLGVKTGIQYLKNTDSITSEQTKKIETKKGFNNLLKAGIICIFYIILFLFVGFVISTFLFFLAMFLLLSKSRRYPLFFAVAIGLTLLIYLVFNVLLNVPFPSGLLF